MANWFWWFVLPGEQTRKQSWQNGEVVSVVFFTWRVDREGGDGGRANRFWWPVLPGE
jgi:hypothetical protein